MCCHYYFLLFRRVYAFKYARALACNVLMSITVIFCLLPLPSLLVKHHSAALANYANQHDDKYLAFEQCTISPHAHISC